MHEQPYNIAIETTSRPGSISLGCLDQLVATVDLPGPAPHQPSTTRSKSSMGHRIDLIPAIAQLCNQHTVTPDQLGQIYLSIGPGSFTGMRIAVATAKMLSQVLGVKLVAVPTLDVVAYHIPMRWPNSHETVQTDNTLQHLAVCLNVKRDSVYVGLYQHQNGQWVHHGQPVLQTVDQFLQQAPRPLAIVCTHFPAITPAKLDGVTRLPVSLATGRSDAVWHLGQAAAKRGEFTDPQALLPLYVRRPQAQELWEKRHQPAPAKCPT